MNSETVQEIANQLGIGVDKILEYLPSYSIACFLYYFIPFLISIVLSIVCIVIFIKNWKSYFYLDNMSSYSFNEYYEDNTNKQILNLVMMFIFGAIGIISIILFFVGVLNIGRMIGWLISPEMMLLQLCITN